MDYPRDRREAARRELKRNLVAGLTLLAVIFGVATLPGGMMWFLGSGDGAGAVGSGTASGNSGIPPTGSANAGQGSGAVIAAGFLGTASERPGDVTFQSTEAVLAGDLILPDGPGPHPAVVAVHGSGRSTRRQLQPIVEKMVPRGFGVLIYDKRGVGRSSGLYSGIGPANSERALGLLADDALAGVRYLAQHPRIDRRRIGLLGFSQAGWIIPKAASRSSLVSFAVIISGPTVTVGEEIYYSRLTGEHPGGPEDLSDREIRFRLAEYDGPLGFDPLPSLRIMTAPTLWILGEADRSIQIPECLARLDRLIEEGKPFQYKLYPRANHGLRLPDGSRIDYWDEIEQFIQAQ